MKFGKKCFLILVASFPSSLGLAQSSVDVGEVHVQGQSEYESEENVSAFTTIIHPERNEAEIRTASEVLDSTVGVNATDLGGLGQLSTVSIRGSSSEQVAVFVDGVRINTAAEGAVDFASIPLSTIDRIEVIRGGGSTRFGTNAIGGVINIVTKQTNKKRAIELRLSGGSFSTFSSAASWAEPFPRADVLLAHHHLSTAGDYSFRSAATNLAGESRGGGQSFSRMHNSSITEDVLTKASIDATDHLKIHISNDFHWSDRQIPGTEEETTLLFPANPLQATETIFRDTSGLTLAFDRVKSDALSWEVGATHLLSHDGFSDPSPAVGDPIDVTALNNTLTGFSAWTHALQSKRASLLSTLRYQYQYDLSRDRSPLPAAQLMGRHVRHTHATGVETELGLFGERLILAPALRLEDASDRKWRISWKGGIVVRPAPIFDLKANVQTSNRYPSFNELYFPDQGYLRGNPDLRDEIALGWDIGFIFHPKRASLEVSYFQNRIDNSILFVPISATTIQPVNTLRVAAHGLECQASATPTDALRLTINYTLTDATFTANGFGLPGRPRHKINGRAEGKNGPVSLYGEVQYVGTYPLNTANTVRLSARTTFNSGTTVRFAKHFFASFEVKDITDVQMYDARGFPLPRRSFWVTVGAKT